MYLIVIDLIKFIIKLQKSWHHAIYNTYSFLKRVNLKIKITTIRNGNKSSIRIPFIAKKKKTITTFL